MTEPKKEEIKEKIEEKKEEAIAKGANPSQVQNVIGEIKPPEDPANKEDVKAFFKEINDKLDKLLAGKDSTIKVDEPPKELPKPKEVAWYDKEII